MNIMQRLCNIWNKQIRRLCTTQSANSLCCFILVNGLPSAPERAVRSQSQDEGRSHFRQLKYIVSAPRWVGTAPTCLYFPVMCSTLVIGFKGSKPTVKLHLFKSKCVGFFWDTICLVIVNKALVQKLFILGNIGTYDAQFLHRDGKTRY